MESYKVEISGIFLHLLVSLYLSFLWNNPEQKQQKQAIEIIMIFNTL